MVNLCRRLILPALKLPLAIVFFAALCTHIKRIKIFSLCAHLTLFHISLFLYLDVLSLGSAPSCSSTPPPAFDDISEGAYNNQSTKHLSNDYRSSSDKRLNSPRSTSYRDDSVR